MDAHELLRSTAATYRDLPFLGTRLIVSARQDEDGFHSVTTQEVRAAFQRPNLARLEYLNRRGQIVVADGLNLHTHAHEPARYLVAPLKRLPGEFNPAFPAASEATFLYERLDERVQSASIVAEESIPLGEALRDCWIVAVQYEPGPHPSLVSIPSAPKFWIDRETRLVLRREFQVEVHSAHLAHPQTTTHEIRSTEVDTTHPPEPSWFHYKAPPGVPVEPHGIVRVGGSAAAATHDPARGFQMETSDSWEGDTLVERARYRIKGHNVAIERRWRVLEHPKVIVISEQVDGPGGEPAHRHERTLSLPYS